MSDSAPGDRIPRHRREGVPLDGAPDLGMYAAPAPAVSEPVTSSSWSDPGEYVPPSPEPPQYPAPPTVSEYQYPAEVEFPPLTEVEFDSDPEG